MVMWCLPTHEMETVIMGFNPVPVAALLTQIVTV